MALVTSYVHGQFSWVDLMAHDMRAASDFYSQLLGWTAVDQDTAGGPPYAQFELDGASVAGLGQMSDEMKAQGIPPFWNNYINVDDLQSIIDKAVELGGTITCPVMKVVEAGWLAFVQDPTGAQIGFWQKNQHCGAQRVGEVGASCWHELATRDVDKARDYYGQLLGWEYALNPHAMSKYYMVKNQGQEIGGLMQMTAEWGEHPSCWMVYFTVQDTDASVEQLQRLGGKVNVPPFDIPVGRMAVVSDAQGVVFNLIQLHAPPS